MKTSAIELHIDELVLHGFAQPDRWLVAEALERELARLFAEPGAQRLNISNQTLARLDAGTFTSAPQSSPAEVGAQVAQAIYRGLSR